MTLRHGFTTGTAAAAAAKAATLGLLFGKIPRQVDVPLPMGSRLDITIEEQNIDSGQCMAAVIKDAGDDPDVTHGAMIRAVVTARGQGVHLQGGSGVGLVTRPGLPVPVGQPAINPVPRQQITLAVQEALELKHNQSVNFPVPGLSITISVDNGAVLAQKTFNPRLGIVNGISILGTRGTVKPFSHWAYQATIRQSLDVMRACQIPCPALTTGGRSEKFLRQAVPELEDMACVQVADFFFFSMRELGRRGFTQGLWGVFFGKLVKQAQGHRYTHAKSVDLDLKTLAHWCGQCGFSPDDCQQVAKANTARQVLEDFKNHPALPSLLTLLTTKAIQHAQRFSQHSHQPTPHIDYVLFDFDGQVLHDTRGKA